MPQLDPAHKPIQSMPSLPPVVCPRCASPSVQAIQLASSSVATSAIVGDLLGTAAGVTAGTSFALLDTCLACGCQWVAGSEDERRLRALNGQLGDEAKRIELARLAAEAPRPTWLSRRQKGILLVLLGLIVAVAFVWSASPKR